MNVWESAAAGGLLALANAAHCAGMCGVFALKAASLRSPRWSGLSIYGIGKTFSYVFLGVSAGYFGRRLIGDVEGLQVGLGISVALVMLWAAYRLIVPPKPKAAGGATSRFFAPFAQALGRLRQGGANAFAIGALSAWIPCGVVYLAVLQAANSGSARSGGALMATFGLGTLPALFAVGLLGGVLGSGRGRKLALAGGFALLAIAVWTGWRALMPLFTDGAEHASCCH